MSVVGFDFGTDSCIVAVCKKGAKGGPDVIQNEVGNRKTTTMVAFAGNQRYIGDSAVSQAGGNVAGSIYNFKNLLCHMGEEELKFEAPYLPFTVINQGDGSVAIEVPYESKKERFSPQAITAALFAKLKDIAEKGLGIPVKDCVISVPPLWTEKARRAILDAASIAGLTVLSLMNETLALAVTYGLLRKLPKEEIKVCFVDVGASHTNAAVYAFSEGKIRTLGVASDERFGGRNFDMILFNHLAQDIKNRYKMDVTTNPKAAFKLMNCCKRTKTTLSANLTVPWSVEFIMNDRDVSGVVTRDQFDQLSESATSKLSSVITLALQRAGCTMAELHSMEVVGGGSRIPCVSKILTSTFGREVSKTVDSDEGVAKGCALRCAMLSPTIRVREFDIIDQQPFNVAVEWGPLGARQLETRIEPLFVAGSPVPHLTMVAFEGITGPFQIITRYTDSKLAGANRFVLSGFPSALTDDIPIVKVRFQLSQHGIVSIDKAKLMEREPEVQKAVDADAPMSAEGEKKAGEPMDTSADNKAEKKQKYKKTDLRVESQFCSMELKKRQSAEEREAAMQLQDKSIAETSAARDQLERYVLEMRGRIESQNDLAKFGTESEIDNFRAKLEAEDDWLSSDDGFEGTKQEFKKRHGDLLVVGGPMVSRKFELEQRPAAVEMMKKMVAHYQAFAATTEEKYAHITQEQKNVVNEKCNQVDQWLCNELIKQERLPFNVNPCLTKAIIQAKCKELDSVCKPVLNTPKPVPPKVEEKKVEDAPKTTEKPAGEPMDASSEPAQD